MLVISYISKFSLKYRLDPISLPDQFMKKLLRHTWPGNVRQLINLTEQIVVMCQAHFSAEIFDKLYNNLIKYSPNLPAFHPEDPTNISTNQSPYSYQDKGDFSSEIREKTLEHEAYLINEALKKTKYNKSQAAAYLGLSRTTLYNKMKKLNLT